MNKKIDRAEQLSTALVQFYGSATNALKALGAVISITADGNYHEIDSTRFRTLTNRALSDEAGAILLCRYAQESGLEWYACSGGLDFYRKKEGVADVL